MFPYTQDAQPNLLGEFLVFLLTNEVRFSILLFPPLDIPNDLSVPFIGIMVLKFVFPTTKSFP